MDIRQFPHVWRRQAPARVSFPFTIRGRDSRAWLQQAPQIPNPVFASGPEWISHKKPRSVQP